VDSPRGLALSRPTSDAQQPIRPIVDILEEIELTVWAMLSHHLAEEMCGIDPFTTLNCGNLHFSGPMIVVRASNIVSAVAAPRIPKAAFR
jgi:hypothetical protein